MLLPTIILIPLLTTISDCSGTVLFYVNPKISNISLNGDSLTIGLSVNSTDVSLLLERNREISSTYKVYTQDADGNLVATRKARSCQYHGTVIGYNASSVTLSNCDGFRGIIRWGRHFYHIEPVRKSSADNYHRDSHSDYGVDPTEYTAALVDKMKRTHTLSSLPVFKEAHTIDHIQPETTLKSQHKRSKRLAITSYKFDNQQIMRANVDKLERRYMEMSIVVDRKLHITLGRNIQKTTDWVERVVNHIADSYKPYNLIPCLFHLEIWQSANKFTLPDTYPVILNKIGEYRRNSFISNQGTGSDLTLILTGDPFKERTPNDRNVVGAAHTGTMCDKLNSVGVVTAHGLSDRESYVATLITHEIGHLLGMYHDNNAANKFAKDGKCQCPCDADSVSSGYKVPDYCGTDDRCIMFSQVNKEYSYFSICSRRTLEDTSQHRCLFNAPLELHSPDGPVCGNAIVEDGEGCDCGSDQDCPILDPCCEVGTCQLKNTSSCYTGACCTDQCQLQARGTPCRAKTEGMECDFAETCDGLHSACPRDTYKQDGRECQDSSGSPGFCSASDCMTHRSQCQWVFGNRVREADEACWDSNYQRSNWIGNCGYKENAGGDGKPLYYQCKEADKMCGLLQCQVLDRDYEEARQIAQEKGRESVNKFDHPSDHRYTCLTVKYTPNESEEDADVTFIDMGQVLDFTWCGDGRFCQQKKCTYVPPKTCPSINGTECGGHGTCNNFNQCHCDKYWSNDLCVDFDKESADSDSYKTIIIVLCIAVIIVPIVVGLVVYIVKHKFDLKKMAEDRKAISRGIRRFSTRLSSRARRSTRSDETVRRDGTIKPATVTTQYKRVPKIGDSKLDRPPRPLAPGKTAPPARPAPPPIVPPKDKPTVPVRPNNASAPARPSPNNSNHSSKNSTPNSSNTKLNNGVTGGGPPPIKPPPIPSTHSTPPARPTLPVLRNVKGGLKPGKSDDRPLSESFKNVKIPSNLLQGSEKTASDNSLSVKKPLQPPKLLAGRSRESKKLQISGPGTNGSLVGLDGRPKSFLSATDIKQSSDSINTVSSTRALFDPAVQKKPPSRWQ